MGVSPFSDRSRPRRNWPRRSAGATFSDMRAVIAVVMLVAGCGDDDSATPVRPTCDADMALACPSGGAFQVLCEPEDDHAAWCYFDDTGLALEPAITDGPSCTEPSSFAVCPTGFRARCMRCP